MAAKYVLGIDLGTTNSVLAFAPIGVENATVQTLPIPQLVGPSAVESRPMLPSFLYLAAEHERSSRLRFAVGKGLRLRGGRAALSAGSRCSHADGRCRKIVAVQ